MVRVHIGGSKKKTKSRKLTKKVHRKMKRTKTWRGGGFLEMRTARVTVPNPRNNPNFLNMTPLEKAQKLIDEWVQNRNLFEPLILNFLSLKTISEGMLPPTLQKLHCSNNKLTSLPTLPPSLKELYCEGNQLTSLPSLPPTLHYLNCRINKLTSFPELPPTLKHLNCYDNKLTSLPSLPPIFEILSCSNNLLTSLPALPPTLQSLGCDDNKLTSLPTLSPTLESLWCQNNQLTSLPELPPTLQRLVCKNNQLTSLPELPPTLQRLDCTNNPLEFPMLAGETPQKYSQRIEAISRKRIQKRAKSIKQNLEVISWRPTRIQGFVNQYGQNFENHM